MSKTRRAIEQELQRDEVAESVQQTVDSIRRHRTSIIVVVVLILAGIIITSAVRGHRENVKRETNALMDKGLNAYSSLTGAAEEKQRKEHFNTLMAATDTLIQDYAGTKLGREARYLQGNGLYATGKYPKAQEAYQDYLKQAETAEEKAQGEVSLAYAYENESFFEKDKLKQANLLDQALNHYKYAADHAKGNVDYLHYYALLGQARVLELTGKQDEAAKIYEKIMRDRPAPVTPPKSSEGEDSQQALMKMLMGEMASNQAQISFEATAKLRLERLKSAPAGPAQTLATGTATTNVAPAAATAASPAPANPAVTP